MENFIGFIEYLITEFRKTFDRLPKTIYSSEKFKLIKPRGFSSFREANRAQMERSMWGVTTRCKNFVTFLFDKGCNIIEPVDVTLQSVDDVPFTPQKNQDWLIGIKDGGIITFSYYVDDELLTPNKIIDFLKQNFATIAPRHIDKFKFKLKFKGKKVVIDNKVYTFTFGDFFYGKRKFETPKGDACFSEKCKSIRVEGVSTKQLGNLALLLAREFAKQPVMVHDCMINEIHLAYAD